MRNETSNRPEKRNRVCAALALAAAALLLGSVAQAGIEPVPFRVAYFGPFQLGETEIARLSLVAPQAGDEGTPVAVRFYTGDGREVVTQRLRLQRGVVASAEISGRELAAETSGDAPITVWAEVLRLADREDRAGDEAEVADPRSRILVPSLEISDDRGVLFSVTPLLFAAESRN